MEMSWHASLQGSNCFALPELLGNYCTLDIMQTKMIAWACSPTSPCVVTSKSAKKTIFIKHVLDLKYFYGN